MKKNILNNDLLVGNKNFAIEEMSYTKKLNDIVDNYEFHSHPHYEILYIENGSRTLHLKSSKKHILTNSNIALISPNTPHFTRSESPEQTRMLINISPKMAEQLSGFFSKNIFSCFSANILPLSTRDKTSLLRSFTSLLTLAENDVLYSEKILSGAAEILIHLSTIFFKTLDSHLQQISKAHDKIDYVLNYIQLNYNDTLTNLHLAELLGVSENYFLRIFKQTTGQSPYQYISETRIKYAKQLLRNKSNRISDVAISCGFNSLSAFSRTFKNITGQTPKEFQNQS